MCIRDRDTNDWQGVTYGNGRYVAVGYGGYIAYSIDGVNWTSKQVTMHGMILLMVMGNM